MSRSFVRLSLACLLMAGTPAAHPEKCLAQIAGPGDVYFKVSVDQRFQYYAFANDHVDWANFDIEGDVLSWSGARDTVLTWGTVGIASSIDASAGVFAADLSSHIDIQARTGNFHYLTNTIGVDVYVRGGTGTPYWLSIARSGAAESSRLGGLPGGLQPVNGAAFAAFEDSSALVSNGGTDSAVLSDSVFFSGLTTTQIVVGTETYSRVGFRAFTAPAYTNQALCILGCMTEAANFHALTAGRVTMRVYPFATPVSVAPEAQPIPALAVAALANPVRGAATLTFRAPAGERARLEAFDLGGRRVALLQDGPATGASQQLRWDTTGLAGGLYFVTVRAAGRVATARVAVTR
ncbi:MAG: hypothetical protein IT348_02640 [Candidatus Eisenbacteria bacterium]|nr:hypothetical protein [Candidatus Eisenbacteria bacterium]